MKTRLIIILFLLALQLGSIPPCYSQIPVMVEMIPFADGPDRQAYVITIPVADLKKVRDNWSSYIGNNAYGWESEKDGIHRQTGIIEKTISTRKFAIHNEIVTTELGVRLTIWFTQRGKPLVALKTGDRLDFAIKKYIHDFAMDQYKKGIQTQLKDKQRLKQKMEKELEALIQAQEKPKHAISDGDYHAQAATIELLIDEQNLQIQKLLHMQEIIPQ